MSVKETVYVIIGNNADHRGKPLINLFQEVLTESGIEHSFVGELHQLEFYNTPVPVNGITYIEHLMTRRIVLDPVYGYSPQDYIRPPIPDCEIALGHRTQVSVIGRINTGKTLLMNLFSRAVTNLSDCSQVFKTVEHDNYFQPWDDAQLLELLPNIRDRIKVKFKTIPLRNSDTLSTYFQE